jgi:type IV secretory pathway TrbF-like protein
MKKKQKNNKIDPHVYASEQWIYNVRKANHVVMFQRLTIIILLISNVGTILYSYQKQIEPKLLPYIVLQDKETGEVDFAGMIQSSNISVNDAMVRHNMKKFVTNLRFITSDIVVMKKNLIANYYLVNSNGKRMLTDFIQSDNPLKLAMEETTRDIRFTLFEKLSEYTWRCEWEESVRVKGLLTTKDYKTATFTYVDNMEVTTEIEAEENPVPVYFSEFYINDKRR